MRHQTRFMMDKRVAFQSIQQRKKEQLEAMKDKTPFKVMILAKNSLLQTKLC